MTNEEYKQERDSSWRTLADCGINSLPVSLSAICRHYNIYIVKNSSLKTSQLKENQRGKSGTYQGKRIIIVRDTDPIEVQRYTIAHEIRHFLSYEEITERQAERFAIGILAPSCVLWALNIHEPEDIAKLCKISITAARIKAKRMADLYHREQEWLKTKGFSCFLLTDLERKVYEQFKPFIDEYKNY